MLWPTFVPLPELEMPVLKRASGWPVTARGAGLLAPEPGPSFRDVGARSADARRVSRHGDAADEGSAKGGGSASTARRATDSIPPPATTKTEPRGESTRAGRQGRARGQHPKQIQSRMKLDAAGGSARDWFHLIHTGLSRLAAAAGGRRMFRQRVREAGALHPQR
jgi:hypothetical protein